MQFFHYLGVLNDCAVFLVVVFAGLADEGVGNDATSSNANLLAFVFTVEAQRLVMHRF